MFKIIECNNLGVVAYACSEEADIDKLPKKGLTIGSSAEVITKDGDYFYYKFTQEDKNTDGKWIKVV